MRKIFAITALAATLIATPALAWKPITVINETSYGDPHHGTLISITLTDVSVHPFQAVTHQLYLGFGQSTTFLLHESGSCSRNIAIYTEGLPLNADGNPYYTILGGKMYPPGPFNDCTMSEIIVNGKGVMSYR